MNEAKSYLGDSVYAECDGAYYVQVHLDNGYGPMNVIMMEPEVVGAFIRFLKDNAPEVIEEHLKR